MSQLPAHLFKTYQIASPHTTHSRPATCAEVSCKEYTQGWMIQKSILTEKNWHDIHAGKWRYREIDLTGLDEVPEQGIYLMFEAGQPCFRASTHRVSLERPEIYRAGRGRGKLYNPREAKVFSAENWLDDFHTNQDRLQTLAQRG